MQAVGDAVRACEEEGMRMSFEQGGEVRGGNAVSRCECWRI